MKFRNSHPFSIKSGNSVNPKNATNVMLDYTTLSILKKEGDILKIINIFCCEYNVHNSIHR
jgi:hypothetical protein